MDVHILFRVPIQFAREVLQVARRIRNAKDGFRNSAVAPDFSRRLFSLIAPLDAPIGTKIQISVSYPPEFGGNTYVLGYVGYIHPNKFKQALVRIWHGIVLKINTLRHNYRTRELLKKWPMATSSATQNAQK